MTTSFLAKNIQYLRKQRQLSQQGFGEKIGLSRSNIASYENGKAEPRAVKLAEIARFFNISLNQLIEKDLTELDNEKLLPANANIKEDLVEFLENRDATVSKFEVKTKNLKKITEGFRAFIELKISTLEDKSFSVSSLMGDFENLLNVMDNLIASNEELVAYLKKITEKQKDE
jgi:transcriptional regulator with XRE-family HTH domain